MIYIDDTYDNLKDGNGLNLCKAWFLTKYGYKYDKKLAKSLDKVEMKEIGPYKIATSGNEILLVGNTYAVGNGRGTIIYSPCRNNTDIEGYNNGTNRINKKYEVSILN